MTRVRTGIGVLLSLAVATGPALAQDAAAPGHDGETESEGDGDETRRADRPSFHS